MNRVDAAAVVIRILAIWLFVRSLQYGVQAASIGGPASLQGSTAMWFGLFLFLLAGSAVVLWVLAQRLALVLLPRNTGAVQDIPGGATGLEELAFSVVGVYLLASALPNVAYWVAYVVQSRKMNPDGFNPSPDMYASIVRWLVHFAVGSYLLLGSRGLVSFVRRLRGMSPSQEGGRP